MKEQTDREKTDLARLRASIDAVDAEILALLNRRAEYSREVGKIKRETGGPVFCPAREKEVLDRLAAAASGALPDEHLRSIYQEILASSRALQQPFQDFFPEEPGDPVPFRGEGEEEASGAAGSLPAVCIVGCRGKMGNMLVSGLRKAGQEARGLDAGEEGRIASALEGSRIVILCVPVGGLRRALREVAPFLRPEQLLMDITSVKTLPLQWMEESFSGGVVGAHPLFGPSPDPEDMKVALVRGRRAGDEACALAQSLFRRLGCATFWTTAREHDRKAGFAQSLNFTVSAAFFCALARQEGIRPFLTPSFRRAREAARKHLTVDAAMFCEFTSMNPEFPGVLSVYRALLEEAAERDCGGLARLVAEAARWYDEEGVSSEREKN
ncbi:MAG: prephenate dehydrogenase/arogenate dehydrogenase family protein [Deltaproteobacteria bacterium]|jgi:prephenate dehydrogenase|nr:prephenate dehydrogenase/arogenate dehydrogenase family protein [Deltaproteobacteria bacterium]